jgi:SAM-dependent methyltransferase
MKSEAYSRAFTTIAPYYDTLMSFVNYPAWVSYIERILELHNIRENLILDLACGTGVCLELWQKRGFKIIGLDKSLAMLEICKKRFLHVNDSSITLINGDMCNFAIAKKVPIITSLYDSFNYLLTEEALLHCFQNVYNTLNDGGILIFDMNTVHCLRDEWGNSTFHRQDNDIYSVWSNSFDHETFISSLKITLNIQRNGKIITIKEFHQERAYPLQKIAQLLFEAGFEFNLYRHFTFDFAQRNNLRIMGVAKKC